MQDDELESESIDDLPEIGVIQQAEIPFFHDMLLAALGADGEAYIPITPFAQKLGLAGPRRQVARIKRDDTMQECLCKMQIDTAGGKQSMQCLRVDMIALWLTGIREAAVKEEIRPTLSWYKREAARVILAHFQQRALVQQMHTALPMLSEDASLMDRVAYYRALADMYEELDRQRSTLTRHEGEIAALSDDMASVKEALAIMGEVAREVRITSLQASQVQQLVGKIHDATGLHQKTIYGAFNKQWHIPRYDELPAHQFDAAYTWLQQWGRARLS